MAGPGRAGQGRAAPHRHRQRHRARAAHASSPRRPRVIPAPPRPRLRGAAPGTRREAAGGGGRHERQGAARHAHRRGLLERAAGGRRAALLPVAHARGPHGGAVQHLAPAALLLAAHRPPAAPPPAGAAVLDPAAGGGAEPRAGRGGDGDAAGRQPLPRLRHVPLRGRLRHHPLHRYGPGPRGLAAPAAPSRPAPAGDFRYASAMRREPVLRGRRIDRLYLDTTHCRPCQPLPSRSCAARQAARLIRAHPSHCVVVGVYSLGKEALLVELAVEFGTWVVVSPSRLEQMRLLEMPDVFTAEEGAGWIHAVDVAEIHRDALVSWNMAHPTIAILPTGRPVKITHPNIFPIPYSDHSSFSELCEFVKWLKPCSVIPIVKDDMCQAYFQKYLSSDHQALPDLKIPKPVQESLQQQSKTKTRRTVCQQALFKRHSVSQGVVYESPEKHTEEPDGLRGIKVPQQNFCVSAFCSKEGCTGCHVSKEKGKEEQSGEQSGVAIAAGAVRQLPVSDEHVPSGFAELYLLVPLNVLKQNSSQKFDRVVEDFLRRGEAS